MKHQDTKTPRDSTEPPAPENPSVYCPVCSARLVERSCKLVCPACGYYMSCSDFQ